MPGVAATVDQTEGVSPSDGSPPLLRSFLIGTIGAALFAAIFGLKLGGVAWFLHLGHNFQPNIDLARRLFGPGVVIPHIVGHDGQYFWVLARDPLLLHGHADRLLLDRPSYRAQRIAYPLLASPWRLLGERGLLWGLVITNVVIVGFGTEETVRLARLIGAPDRAALLFGVSPTVAVALIGDLSDALAVLAIVVGIRLVLEGRAVGAAIAFTIACLAREASLTVVAAVMFASPGTFSTRLRDWLPAAGPLRGSARWLVAAVPVIAVVAWGVYARWRLGWPPNSIQEFTWPAMGYLKVWRLKWIHLRGVSDALFSIVMWVMLVWLAIRWVRRPTVIRAAALAPCLLVPFYTPQVVSISLNSLRALGPAFTLFGVDLYADAMARRAVRARPAVPTGSP